MEVKKCDLMLYKIIKERSKKMPRDLLYYVLLDWADQHEEVKKEYLKSIDTYVVSYLTEDGKIIDKVFTSENYLNPYVSAKKFYDEKIKEYPSIELWQKGHFLIGEQDKLIFHNVNK